MTKRDVELQHKRWSWGLGGQQIVPKQLHVVSKEAPSGFRSHSCPSPEVKLGLFASWEQHWLRGGHDQK